MTLELPAESLLELVARQLSNLFIYSADAEEELLRTALHQALADCEVCFAANPNKYFCQDGVALFNPFHSGQYCIFLYFLSREAGKLTTTTLADRIYCLNKALNGCDLFHQVQLPTIFRLDHPVGSVMGRAKYGNYFSFAQNCTVGNNNGVYPVIGERVTMCVGSKILGNCQIGSNVILGADACVKDESVPDNSLVFGASPQLIIKPNTRTPPW
jgi:serine O-acetyltransferase